MKFFAAVLVVLALTTTDASFTSDLMRTNLRILYDMAAKVTTDMNVYSILFHNLRDPYYTLNVDTDFGSYPFINFDNNSSIVPFYPFINTTLNCNYYKQMLPTVSGVCTMTGFLLPGSA